MTRKVRKGLEAPKPGKPAIEPDADSLGKRYRLGPLTVTKDPPPRARARAFCSGDVIKRGGSFDLLIVLSDSISSIGTVREHVWVFSTWSGRASKIQTRTLEKQAAIVGDSDHAIAHGRARTIFADRAKAEEDRRLAKRVAARHKRNGHDWAVTGHDIECERKAEAKRKRARTLAAKKKGGSK